jgi:hypothetical protein
VPIFLTVGLAGIRAKTPGAKIGMNIFKLDNVTFLHDRVRETETIPGNALGALWSCREGQSDAKLCVNKTSDGFLPTTAFFRTGTTSISPQLRDAILSLHRDDCLRRAYLRRCWTETPASPRLLRQDQRARGRWLLRAMKT